MRDFSKKNISVVDVARKEKEGRKALSCVDFTKEFTEATNGFSLVRVTIRLCLRVSRMMGRTELSGRMHRHADVVRMVRRKTVLVDVAEGMVLFSSGLEPGRRALDTGAIAVTGSRNTRTRRGAANWRARVRAFRGPAPGGRLPHRLPVGDDDADGAARRAREICPRVGVDD